MENQKGESMSGMDEAWQCDQCRYWQLGEPDETSELSRMLPKGECRRHAPSAQPRIKKLTGTIDTASGELDLYFENECIADDIRISHSWPVTHGSDWCGEFLQRPLDQTRDSEVGGEGMR